jgi:hypothetical protein
MKKIQCVTLYAKNGVKIKQSGPINAWPVEDPAFFAGDDVKEGAIAGPGLKASRFSLAGLA